MNSRSLLFDGKPWFPAMGEFHYARVPESEWRTELLKVKAGGIDIVSTYVFWIHHEEIQGQWDWNGRRNLKKFLQTCNEVGLKVLVRCGPWCHGEVRNGGLPDWVVAHRDWKLRSTDPNFLAAVKVLYTQIAEQMRGELWKDGGPVIGIQVDNEFHGSPNHLMALKQMAIAAGINVPLYTKTGWPAMSHPVPLGELLPFFGAYADGFWDRSILPMTGNNWENFTFKYTRTDTGVGNDTLGNRKEGDTPGTDKYPYLTCEIGGGMETSYHRRINYDPRDVEAVALCQLGSGSSLMGYYMYHGGQNPDGKLTTLQESQATGYPNDLPVKSYDFNASIGEYGQLNPQYFWLRRLHLFLHDFGSSLAQMPLTMPDVVPVNKDDLATLRWSVRSDGRSGYVFVNNYQRLQPMPARTNVQFKLTLPAGELVFPQTPVTIPDGDFFFWPFNLDLGGAKLIYATAQPVCQMEEGGVQRYFFAETPGLQAEFIFDPKTLSGSAAEFHDVKPGRNVSISLKNKRGERVEIVLLSRNDSLAMRKSDDGKHMIYDEPQKLPV
ncbi:MAG TPA: beta-galactosidase, partial [Candidatus Binatia bacterium]|nr:beta-galactosidase [Candidatus Binatia bacterium]